MNKVVLIGRIANDLEKRETDNGLIICKYQLAVRRDANKSDFINITTFGAFVNTLIKYCHKGDLIGIEGRIQISNYKKDNETRYSYSIITENIEFLNLKKEEKKEEMKEASTEKPNEFELVLDDDDLPF